jgi:hypothetical protein
MKDEFHEIALKSILFKGRNDLYFCYLKSERIAHVIAVLAKNSAFKDTQNFEEARSLSSRLPHILLHFVAGEIDPALVLADILSLTSVIRLMATESQVSKKNSLVLVQEYENIARMIAAENHPSPFISTEDFSIQEIENIPEPRPLFPQALPSLHAKQDLKVIKDIDKGHGVSGNKEQNDRASLILDFVLKNNGVSIKDIAEVIKGCSEKTIQRELGVLIRQGLIKRRGERRWSVYIGANFKGS